MIGTYILLWHRHCHSEKANPGRLKTLSSIIIVTKHSRLETHYTSELLLYIVFVDL